MTKSGQHSPRSPWTASNGIRLDANPDRLSGAWCLLGTRMPVWAITPRTDAEVRAAFPHLTAEQVAALREFADEFPHLSGQDAPRSVADEEEVLEDRVLELAIAFVEDDSVDEGPKGHAYRRLQEAVHQLRRPLNCACRRPGGLELGIMQRRRACTPSGCRCLCHAPGRLVTDREGRAHRTPL